MTTISKTDQAIAAFDAGDFKKALHISKDFRIGVSKEDRDRMALAYECLVRPDFYRQLGTDIEAAIDEGKAVFEIRVAKDYTARCPQCQATQQIALF